MRRPILALMFIIAGIMKAKAIDKNINKLKPKLNSGFGVLFLI
jgi:hypothetical protein